MKKTFSLIIVVFFFSCSNKEKTASHKEEADGGPCSYHEEYFPLRILEIDSSNFENCELTLLKIIEEDTIYYTHYNSNPLSTDEIYQNKIQAGDTITFTEKEITKGSCNPFIQTVSIERFNSKLAQ